jgi:O-acetyl-ADP-ribose deacetylase (regulator of RNase III)
MIFVDGDLIKLGQEGYFDVIAHGCNCFCTMGAGIAPQMAKAFGADKFPLEAEKFRGDINKLGMIDYKTVDSGLILVNAYTQYGFGANHPGGTKTPVDYDAIVLAFKKMNHLFKGKRIGLPKIGCGLAGGEWPVVMNEITHNLTDCNVTVINYKP